MAAGCAFGGLALLYNCPRTATVKATTDSQVWGVSWRPGNTGGSRGCKLWFLEFGDGKNYGKMLWKWKLGTGFKMKMHNRHNHHYQLFWRMHFANSREFTCFCSEASGIAFKQMLQQNATKHQARGDGGWNISMEPMALFHGYFCGKFEKRPFISVHLIFMVHRTGFLPLAYMSWFYYIICDLADLIRCWMR